MQRLFSTFANGWPGAGLLFQRLVTGFVLLYSAIILLEKTSPLLAVAPQIIATGAGIFLLLGLWTPVMGTLVAIAELWVALAGVDTLWVPIFTGTLGATLAMIGPGAWSIDAKLFGRKRLTTPFV